jgi:hypothetical protein
MGLGIRTKNFWLAMMGLSQRTAIVFDTKSPIWTTDREPSCAIGDGALAKGSLVEVAEGVITAIIIDIGGIQAVMERSLLSRRERAIFVLGEGRWRTDQNLARAQGSCHKAKSHIFLPQPVLDARGSIGCGAQATTN